MWHKLSHYQNAIFDFTRLIEINSENVDALHERGLAYSEMNKFENEFQDFGRVLENDREFFSASFSIAELLV